MTGPTPVASIFLVEFLSAALAMNSANPRVIMVASPPAMTQDLRAARLGVDNAHNATAATAATVVRQDIFDLGVPPRSHRATALHSTKALDGTEIAPDGARDGAFDEGGSA